MNRAHTLAEAVTKGRGTERSFLCPVHGDSRPSASLNMIKQKWYCYTCGAHGSLTGEYALMEPDYLQMKIWFSQKMEEHRVYPESWLSRYDAGPVHPYWLHRVGEPAARAFRLGYDVERDAVTYPLRDAGGRVLGVVRRQLAGADGPKYLYPRGIDVGRLLFNYSTDHRQAVVLCEGALDAIALWNIGVTASAIYGSRLSEEQIKLVDRIDPDYVFCAFDNDDAGFSAYLQVKHGMKHRRVVRLKWPYSWGKDVDELSVERRTKVLAPVLALTDVPRIESASCQSPKTNKPLSSTTLGRGGMQIRRTQN